MPYYSRWLWSVGRIPIEKKHITSAALTDRLAEVQQRYAGPLEGRSPQAQPKFEGDPSNVTRNCHVAEVMGKGDPQRFAGQAGPARFKHGERVGMRDLPAMFCTSSPKYCRGAEGVIAEVAYGTPAPQDETWDREAAPPERVYIVRFNQSELWDNSTGPQNDIFQTEIPERSPEALDA